MGATLPEDDGKDQGITTETMVCLPEPQGATRCQASKQAKKQSSHKTSPTPRRTKQRRQDTSEPEESKNDKNRRRNKTTEGRGCDYVDMSRMERKSLRGRGAHVRWKYILYLGEGVARPFPLLYASFPLVLHPIYGTTDAKENTSSK
jgi:hypothetical protein